MNGCKNKSSFFESKGARGGNQAAGPGMDKIWVRRDRERPFQNRHGKAISIMWAKHGGRNLLGKGNVNTSEVERKGHDQEAEINDAGISVPMPTIKERTGLGAG